jgi:zinc/manganese transport system permease protein
MFALLRQDYVQNALVAGTFVAVAAGVIGYFVVLRSLAFAGESLSHIGFAGAAGAFLFGISSLAGSCILTLLAALGIGALGERARGRDIETGMVLTFALGLGVLFLGLYASGGHSNATVAVLFGSILSVTRQAVVTTAILCLGVLAALVGLFRPLLFASVDPELAEARGVPVRLLSVLILLLLAVTVAAAIEVVGALLVFALLLAPAATAQRWSRRPLATVALSAALSLAFTWSALFLSFVNLGRYLPVSFYISALAALSYLVSYPLSRRGRPRVLRLPRHPDRETLPRI